MKLILFQLIFISISLPQVFSPDIVIDSKSINQVMRSMPAIDINSHQDLGLAWSIETSNEAIVEFTKSYDGGNTFDTVRTVDSDPFPPWYLFDFHIPVLKFDYYDNPLILYLTSDWISTSNKARIKKSQNGGLSFPVSPFGINTSYDALYDYLFINDTLGILAHSSNTTDIKIMASHDGGMTFNDLSVINCGHIVTHKITLVKCGNGDILCLWTAYFPSPVYTNVYYARSTDNGRTFSNIQALNLIYKHANGIYASNYQNYIFVTYFAADSARQYIVFQKSDDNGISFPPPTIVTDELQSISHPYPEIRFNPNVGIALIWGQWQPTYFTHSTDMGNTFHPIITLPNNEDRFRYYNSMTISDSGEVYVASLIYFGGTADYIVLNKLRLPLLSSINATNQSYPTQYILNQNYPNPFNSSTQISFYIPNKSPVGIKIYDINGRVVKEILSEIMERGFHTIIWNGRDQKKGLVSSGVYIFQLKSKNITINKKLMFIK